MNIKSREKLLAGVAALSFLGISPQQTFAAQITTSQAVQQTKKITGNISDTMGPIIGATVKVKGTKNAVVTDMDGNYTLNVAAGQTVEVSYVGYITKSFKVGGAEQVRHYFDRRQQQSSGSSGCRLWYHEEERPRRCFRFHGRKNLKADSYYQR